MVKHTDSAMHQRFTTAVYNAIKLNTSTPQGARTPLNSNMESLHGYEFNTHSLFANYFKAVIIPQLNSGNELTITLPAFDPKTDVVFPNGCTSAKLAVYVIATDFGDTTTPQVFHTLLPINKNSLVPAQTLLTTPVLPAGHLVLVVAKLLYYTPNPLTESNYLNTKDFSPAMVVLAETVPE